MSRSSVLSALALLVGVVFIGLGLAVADIYFAALITAAVLAVPLLLLPLEQILWGGWVLTFLVAGPLGYFGLMSKAFWLPYLFGALLFVRLPIDAMSRARRKSAAPVAAAENPLKKWAFVFFAIALFSSVLNAAPVLQVLLALKEYLFLWSILVVIGLGFVSFRYFVSTWKAMLWLVLLHIPVVTYQRFIVVPARGGSGSFDAVSGLFGGDPMAGGATGAMGMVLLFALLLGIALWRAGKLRGFAVAGIGITCIAIVLLAEVKVFILMLPVGIALLYRHELLHQPFRALMMLLISLALAAGIAVVYQSQYGDQYNAYKGPFGYLERAIEANTDSEAYDSATGEIRRIAAIKYWWTQHGMDDPATFLIGHGLGSTRYGTVMGTQALKNPFFRIDRHTAAVYLWETGLLGLAAFVGFLVAAARLAVRLSRDVRLGVSERAVLSAIAALLLLQPVILVYDKQQSAIPATQMLLMLMAGQALFSARRAAARSVWVAGKKNPQIAGTRPSKALVVA